SRSPPPFHPGQPSHPKLFHTSLSLLARFPVSPAIHPARTASWYSCLPVTASRLAVIVCVSSCEPNHSSLGESSDGLRQETGKIKYVSGVVYNTGASCGSRHTLPRI